MKVFSILSLAVLLTLEECHPASSEPDVLRGRQNSVSQRQRRNNEGELREVYPKNCQEIFDQGSNTLLPQSGMRLIKPTGSDAPFQVYCNNSVDGGGWTVIQRRTTGSVKFYRPWDAYKNGFGNVREEFWLGNDKIALLTNQKNYELRIDITQLGTPYFAKYELFRIGREDTNYKLLDIGGYDPTSSVGFDAMSWHKGRLFSTWDRDNDGWDDYHCAEKHVGAWWFGQYSVSNNCACDYRCDLSQADGDGCVLCGKFNPNSDCLGSYGTNMYWKDIRVGRHDCGLEYVEMKVREASNK